MLRYDNMGAEPETQGSSGGPSGNFRKVWGLEHCRVGDLGGGAEGERAETQLSNCCSPTDLQAPDGEEATGAH